MVDLVLDHAGLEAAGLDLDGVAELVLGRHADVDRTLDVDDHAGQRQAALLHDLGLLAAPLDHRVDEGVDRALLLDAVDEHAVERADLRGGEADPDRVDHQPPHPRDLLAQRVVEDLDLAPPGAQDGIAELADLAQRELAASTRFVADAGRRDGRGRLFFEDLVGHRLSGYWGSTSTLND